MAIAELQSLVALVVSVVGGVASLYNWSKGRREERRLDEEERRLDAEITDRKAVEARALDLVHQLGKERRAHGDSIVKDEQGKDTKAGRRVFNVGEDRVRDRAAMLAKEWGALKVDWQHGRMFVAVRDTLNEPRS